MLRRIVEVVVDPDTERKIRVFRRSGDDDFFGTGFEVFSGSGFIEEKAGRFENHVYSFATPIEICRVALGGCENAVTVHRDRLVIILYRAMEATGGGVILQQVSERFVVRKVVDRNDFFELFWGHRTQHIASDASKSIDSVRCHIGRR